jgi:quercetin dioxygenase-like cupin family protein
MALQGKLSHPRRFITTHDARGKAVIDQSMDTEAPFYELNIGDALFAECYVTKEFPARLEKGADIANYQGFLASPPGLTVSTGTVLRYVDMPPGATSPMHQTLSLDYGVVLEGKVELILDSGETRVLERGDICVQRATMHAWKNLSDTEWARMLYILQPALALVANGKEIKEDYGGMQGVNAST